LYLESEGVIVYTRSLDPESHTRLHRLKRKSELKRELEFGVCG